MSLTSPLTMSSSDYFPYLLSLRYQPYRQKSTSYGQLSQVPSVSFSAYHPWYSGREQAFLCLSFQPAFWFPPIAIGSPSPFCAYEATSRFTFVTVCGFVSPTYSGLCHPPSRPEPFIRVESQKALLGTQLFDAHPYQPGIFSSSPRGSRISR